VIFTGGKLLRLHLHPKKVGMLPLGPGKQTENFTASEDSFTAEREVGRIYKCPNREFETRVRELLEFMCNFYRAPCVRSLKQLRSPMLTVSKLCSLEHHMVKAGF
jgi:hypothetical protein